MNLYEKIVNREEKISLVGLGYVGMPIAVSFARKADVIGFDLNAKKVELYKQGIDPTQEVGDDVIKNTTVANNVQFLAHDDTTVEDLGYRKVGKIVVGNNVFFGAKSLVLMNVKIGDDVIVAAGSVVTHDIPSNSVVVGMPAKVIGLTSDYIEKNRLLMSEKKVFNVNYSTYGDFTNDNKKELIDALTNDFAYVKIRKFSKG